MSTDNKSGKQDLISESLARNATNDSVLIEEARPRSPSEALEPERAPEPPARRSGRRTHPVFVIMNGIMTLLVVAMLGLGALIYFAKMEFDRPGPLTHSTVVAIPKGEGVNAIAARLEREGIISDRRIFVASVLYFSAQDKLRAGEYEFRKGASMRDVLDKIVRGKSILHQVTIPEGLTSKQVVERLREEPLLAGEISEVPPEGSLMPDTYKFSRGMTRQEMIERMQAEQREFLENLWATRADDLPLDSMAEAITLASIVEKETARADERARVAGVFINRLRRGMRLQSDPTTIYGLTGGDGLGRGLLEEELAEETPYNTYQIDGLPPGPIANPGRAAIQAVLNPAETDDLYFVADGSGGHAFAETLAAHNENVARWREIERKRREREAAEAKEREDSEEAGRESGDGSAGEGEAEPSSEGESLAADVQGLSVDGAVDIGDLGLPQADDAEPAGASAEAPSGGGVPLPRRKPATAQ